MVWVDTCSRHVSFRWWWSIKTLEPPVTESEGGKGVSERESERESGEKVNEDSTLLSVMRVYVILYFVEVP